jgi:hypothetical protein
LISRFQLKRSKWILIIRSEKVEIKDDKEMVLEIKTKKFTADEVIELTLLHAQQMAWYI